MARLKVGVLISGRGSNLEALIAAAATPLYPAEIALVISNRADAAGLRAAGAAGIPHAVLSDPDRRGFAAQAAPLLKEHSVGLVCLAGFMRLLDRDFVESWRNRMLNIHPSLLPAFPGLHAQRQALAAGVRFSGCTVHFVRPEVDTGPIVGQGVVPVDEEDDEESLSQRILAVEHRLYPLTVRLIAEKRVQVEGNRVTILGAQRPSFTALFPAEPAC